MTPTEPQAHFRHNGADRASDDMAIGHSPITGGRAENNPTLQRRDNADNSSSSEATTEIRLANDAAISDDGWVLLAPFGEHPLTRRVLGNDGIPVLEHYIQVLDNAAADDLVGRENTLFRRLKRAWVGLPVYREHPDLSKHEPRVLTNQRAQPEPLGTLDRIRKSDRGIEGHITLLADKSDAVEKDGCKYPSVLWNTLPVGKRGDATLVKPYQLLSVGLTATPNISGVEALANSQQPINSTPPLKTDPDNRMRDKLIGWLVGQGTTLANDASDTLILEAVQKKVSEAAAAAAAKTGEALALGNSRAALETEKTDLTTRLAAARTSLASLRKSAAGLAADLAIQKGIIPVARRDSSITTLSNSADLDAEAAALLQQAPTIKVGDRSAGQSAGDRMALDNAAMRNPREVLLGMVSKKMAETGSKDFVKSYAEVCQENPALLTQLKASAEGGLDKR